MTKVCVIGSGSWGSALACVAARAGHDTIIWGRSEATVDEINTSHTNTKYSYGMAMGKGERLEGLKLAEGAHTAGIALKIAEEHEIDVPIISAIVNVLEKKTTAREAVHALLTRPLKREI